MPSVTNAQRHKLNRDPIADPHVILLEFQEDARSTVHRAVINNEDVTHNGNTYVATDISVTLPDSGAQDPSVRLEMSNLSRVVGATVARAKNRIGCRIMLIDTSDPDVTLSDSEDMFILGRITLNGIRISATLMPRASTDEPLPYRRTSKLFFPGVWWTV